MTTGRINQVTIVAPRPPPESRGQGPAPGGAAIIGGRSEDESRLGHGYNAPVKERFPGPSDCPHWVPQGAVDSRSCAACGNVGRSVVCAPREEDTPARSHRPKVDGYRAELAPRNLKEILVKDQPSTDLGTAEERR